jgi:hypothetical protein
LAYESGTHALRQLLLVGRYGGRITRVPEKIITLPGESYYFVEISSQEGTRYIIEAYGEEARELEHEASSIKGKEEILITA